MLDFGDTRLCRITASGGDGTYTATEVARKADNSGWDTLSAPSGLVAFTLREVNDSTALAVDDIVPFWRALGKGQNWRYYTSAALTLASAPSDGHVARYDTTGGWVPTDPSVVTAESIGFNKVVDQFIQFNDSLSVATQEVTIDDADFRDTIVKVEAWMLGDNSDPPDITSPFGKSSGTDLYLPPALFWVDATPAVDVKLMEGGNLDLILDKDDGKLKWSYTQTSPYLWGYCIVWVRNSTTPDVIVSS